jgi:hypothetical protein
MERSDWVLNAYCRSCGVGSVARVGDDDRIVWPDIIHEANCPLAPRDSDTQSTGALGHLEPGRTSPRTGTATPATF